VRAEFVYGTLNAIAAGLLRRREETSNAPIDDRVDRPRDASRRSALVSPLLLRTFVHLRGVSLRGERTLWRKGIRSWDDLERALINARVRVGSRRRDALLDQLAGSRAAVKSNDVLFFGQQLPRSEHFRLPLAFRMQTLFLDIETTGLSRYYDRLTVVGWALGGEQGIYITGEDETPFRMALSRAAILVTFNGSGFDVPFLRHVFPGITLPAIHVDLRYLGRRIGLKGSQKAVERSVGATRSNDLRELDGSDAPLLWYRYCYGDVAALRRLLRYNRADIEGMRVLLATIAKRLLRRQGFPLKSEEAEALRYRPRQVPIPGVSSLPAFRGKVGPVVTYQDLSAHTVEGLRVVGIDLTGSESRASGWALLEGHEIHTRLVASDEELIEETIRAKPHLVSIDSPLSLPRGPQLDQASGQTERPSIMRSCERVLRQRGVNVYPCLIPSMRNLTLRGIRLAMILRDRGVAVIESYPGAAQDILGIPRKRASLELLKRGLNSFGLSGEWVQRSVSHDELDAITSGLVGIFYWSGRFEALGNETESYLIVPDVSSASSSWQHRLVVGLSGPTAVGKTTAATILREQGYVYGRFSAVLADLLRNSGAAVSRRSLQELGKEIYATGRQRWLCEQVVAGLPKDADLVIDGLRHPEDHAYLTETFGPAFLHMHITAPRVLRENRYRAQEYSSADFTEANAHRSEADVDRLELLAHVQIENNGSIGELRDAVTSVIRGSKHQGTLKCQ